MLRNLADLGVGPKQVERLTEAVGGERVRQRDAAVAAFEKMPLAEKFVAPPGVTAPALAVVMADGGRSQIRDAAAVPAAEPAAGPEGDRVETPASGQPEWEEEEPPKKGHWREDKVGLLLTMTSPVAADDPCPDVPASFLDVVRVPKLARQLKKTARAGGDAAEESEDPRADAEALTAPAVYETPEVRTRRVAASRQRWPAFAPQLAAAAWAAGFQGAGRKAFVADGSFNNWRLQRRFFGTFVPVLDFIHALSYVFAAALAGRPFAAGWACYREWIALVWRGEVGAVIAALVARQAELGMPAAGEPETSPASVVTRTLSYLQNHREKMRYAEYRRDGLPITSSLIESTVKQINQRVKGSEKFWTERGSEAVLQLRADQISDGAILETFWEQRQAEATGQRRYRRSA